MYPFMILFLLLIQSFAFGDDSIGKVTSLQGTAKAADLNQVERPLKPSDPIYLNDSISVSDASKIQLKFTDGTLLNLAENTIYRMDEYQYRVVSKPDSYSGSLLEGGFRALTGSIAKKNPEQYTFKTPSGVIGVRGTIVEASVSGKTAFFGCESGRAIVCNQAGCETIGIEAVGQYCVCYSANGLPQLLANRPKQLNLNFSTPPGGESFGKEIPQQEKQNKKGPLIEERSSEKEQEKKNAPPHKGTSIQSSGC